MKKGVRNYNKCNTTSGITLISLVVTIIVLIILAGVSINLVLGENGIITTAKRAREEMTIAEGKEKIELAIAEMKIEKESKGESCTLDYISQNIETRAKGIVLEGVKGTPAVKMYLSYKDYMYKIESNLSVADIGNINVAEQPSIEIMRDVSQTGVEQVNLTVKATVDDGDISEIVKPDGSIEYASEVTYAVTENGNYTFKAVTEKGITEEKTVSIEQIKLKNAIEIVTSSGSDSGDATVSCTHIYETKYDTSNHWKQCILCANKIDVVSHNLTIEGEESCYTNVPAQIQYCNDRCGYKITLSKKAHSLTTVLSANTYNNAHRKNCSICGYGITSESCRNANGEILGCATGIAGTCITCGENRKTNHMQINPGKCVACGKEFCEVNLSKEVLNQNQIKLKYKYIPIIEGIELKEHGIRINIPSVNATITEDKFTKNADGSVEVEGILNITAETLATNIECRGWFAYTYEGGSHWGYASIYTYPDTFAPTVKSITVSGADSTTEFSRSATITAKFEETWDSIVEMALYDSDGSVISNWSVASKEGTVFTKEFNVVTETTISKELTVKAKDRCGNIAEGKVSIGKIDTKAPELVSTTNYNDIWRISLPIKIEATDEGSGNVEIALGSETDYQIGTLEGNKYTRSYNLVGDIYEDIVRIVYLKDGVGNVVTKRLNIGKLDRTSPTITNISNSNGTVTIEANDINTDLNKVGSGIKGYAISKSREIPADNGFQTNNTFTLTETGKYYIWVKDNAGNYSETRQIQIN